MRKFTLAGGLVFATAVGGPVRGDVGEPVFIANVRSAFRAGVLEVEVAGEKALDPAAVRSELDDGTLTLNVEGTRARKANRSWGDIRAHRHRSYTEIVVPTGAGCAGPVSVQGTGEGNLRAVVRCASPPASAGVSVADVEVKEKKADGPRHLVRQAVAVGVERVEHATAEKAAEELKAAVALEEAPGPSPAAAVAAPASPPGRGGGTEAASAQGRGGEGAAVASVQGRAGEGAVASKDEANAGGGTPPVTVAPQAGASFLGGVLPVILLVAVAVIAVVLRRRKGAPSRMIRILETQSLGPKRSLIVARLGEETLVLGASEAGISLIRTQPASARIDDEPSATPTLSKPQEDTACDEPGQVRFLARLFKGRRKDDGIDVSFDDLVDESLEDRELREKLAMGVGGRIP